MGEGLYHWISESESFIQTENLTQKKMISFESVDRYFRVANEHNLAKCRSMPRAHLSEKQKN